MVSPSRKHQAVTADPEKWLVFQKSLFDLLKRADATVTDTGDLVLGSALADMLSDQESARVFVNPLVDIYKAYDRKVDTVIGFGESGTVFAQLVAQEFRDFYKGRHQVTPLVFKSIDLKKRKAEFVGGSCNFLRNRRTLFVTPVLNPSMWPLFQIGATAVKDGHNIGSVFGIATIIQYGRRPPGILIGCEVESLMDMQFPM